MSLTLELLRPCLEGSIPSKLVTCSSDGIPNVAYISQVDYVDSRHVALSFQFFNKTRENILANPQAVALVINPQTAQTYQLTLRYLRTETAGPVFERMKARLAGIASHTGMAGVFRLRGSDIYVVEQIYAKPGKVLPETQPRRACISALRQACDRLASCNDLEGLLQTLLDTLQHDLAIHHAMVMMWDSAAERLYTVASLGYTQSGIGSEIVLGDGIIGVAAQQRTPIRIPHMTSEYGYRRAIRDNALRQGMSDQLDAEIPLVGLAQPASQLAVPILAGGTLQGVLYVESTQDNCFNYDDEDLLVTLASQLGLMMRLLQHSPDSPEPVATRQPPPPSVGGEPLLVKRYHSNDSVFLGDDYLIKGVAGAIFWRLLQQHQQTGRSDFCNRELRLDPALRLPDIDDNLEARLILLSRRLAERCQWLSIEKTGRGRFRLQIGRPYSLQEIA